MRFVGLWLTLALIGSIASSRAEDAAPAPPPRPGDRSGDPAVERARLAVEEHVRRTMRESGGVYPLADPRSKKTLELEFVGVSLVSGGSLWTVHDPDRRVDPHAFFACLLFHPVGGPQEKVYDVDMLVEPRDGGLAVTDVRLHKEKRLVAGKWIWEARSAGGADAGRR
jgi:hypothetical protein